MRTCLLAALAGLPLFYHPGTAWEYGYGLEAWPWKRSRSSVSAPFSGIGCSDRSA
jgi:hypothetical protein